MYLRTLNTDLVLLWHFFFKELLQHSSFDTREGKELLRNVAQSYRDPVVGATLKFEKLELVFNDQLSREVSKFGLLIVPFIQ